MADAVARTGSLAGTSASWPFRFNYTTDRKVNPAAFAAYQALWSPTTKVNTHENVLHHMLQLRTMQGPGAHGHVGYYPLQSFKLYWTARELTNDHRTASLGWPVVCEVGFGTGMSTAILATATSSPASSLVGGMHYVFDCRYCAGTAAGKTPSWTYLKEVFGARLERVEGPSGVATRATRHTPDAQIPVRLPCTAQHRHTDSIAALRACACPAGDAAAVCAEARRHDVRPLLHRRRPHLPAGACFIT